VSNNLNKEQAHTMSTVIKKEPPAPPMWLSVQEVARELRVSTRTVWTLIKDGRLPVTRAFGHPRIARSSITPKEIAA
jgi:excisionase family DNA binding protein